MITELKQTVELMNSSDYKDRFKAEYYQLKIRFNKLREMCLKWDAGNLNFVPTCPRNIYEMQLNSMGDYLKVLEERAAIEKVEL